MHNIWIVGELAPAASEQASGALQLCPSSPRQRRSTDLVSGHAALPGDHAGRCHQDASYTRLCSGAFLVYITQTLYLFKCLPCLHNLNILKRQLISSYNAIFIWNRKYAENTSVHLGMCSLSCFCLQPSGRHPDNITRCKGVEWVADTLTT